MDVHPDIAALRSDLAPQRLSQAAMEAARQAWRAEPGNAALAAELDRFGCGAPLEDCPSLEAIFTGSGDAELLARQLARHYCAAMAENPLAHPPFRNGFTGSAGSLLLARAGRAQLLLQFCEPGEAPSPSYLFSDAVRFDAVLAGKATARIVRITGHEADSVRFSHQQVFLTGGERFALDLANEAFCLDRVERRLVVLRLVRAAPEPDPVREYEPESGRLLRQSAAKIATSRQEALVTLLGRMGRKDAAPYIARIALGCDDPSLRWQAIREGLALDTQMGFCTLAKVARKSEDPLAAQAGALRAQLLETYPQLAQLEADECPA